MTEIENKVGDYLSKNGIDCSLNGYRYLQTAILYTMRHPSMPLASCYAYVADKYRCSSKRVAGGITYALRGRKIRPKQFIHGAAVNFIRQGFINEG